MNIKRKIVDVSVERTELLGAIFPRRIKLYTLKKRLLKQRSLGKYHK